MDEKEVHIMLSNIKIDNDNLDYIKATGEICGKLRDDLVILFASSKHYHKNNGVDDACDICGYDIRNPIHIRGEISGKNKK